MQHGNYTINIKVEVTNDESGEKFITDETESVSMGKYCLDRIENRINEYDKASFKQCVQCKDYFHLIELSEPEGESLSGKNYCQDCLEKIMVGAEKIED